MIKVTADTSKFVKETNNVLQYAIGFFEGVKGAESKMLANVGKSAIEMLKEFIDSNARMTPEALHHVYEWHEAGSPAARIFDIEYRVVSGGLSFNSTFRQSTSLKMGSKTPFYDKARIMEQGIPVTIVPIQSKVLALKTMEKPSLPRDPLLWLTQEGLPYKAHLRRPLTHFSKTISLKPF